jgi:hypothetical protein
MAMLAGCRWLIVGGLVLFFFGLLAILGRVPVALATPAQDVEAASTVDVDTTDDETTPGDGFCSLREALERKTGCVGDTIVLQPATYLLTDTIAGDLTIVGTTSMTITVANGGRAIIQGGPGWNDRILRVQTTSPALVTISDVTFQGGQAVDLSRAGGGIYNSGSLALIKCQVFDNTASLGGGIFNNGSLRLTKTLVVSNTATAADFGGGGIYSTASLLINNSAVVSNTATNAGGGIYYDSAIATLKNVTLSGNRSDGNGGGMFVTDLSVVGLSYVTVVSNTAATSGGGIVADGVSVITSTLLAGNTNGDCTGTNLVSRGYNLIQTSCTMNVVTANPDLIGVDPHIGPLQDNGGSTLTHALTGASQAVDYILPNPSYCPSAGLTDQRGTTRPQSSGCDVGAFEVGLNLSEAVYLPLVQR